MGLIATQHIIEDKSVYYNVSVVNGHWEYFAQNIKYTKYIAYEYHRYCTKKVEWVGCSLDQATALKNDLIEQYNRTYRYSEFVPSAQGFEEKVGGTRLMADVSMAQTQGHLYTVSLNVREEDVRLSFLPNQNADNMFIIENGREY